MLVWQDHEQFGRTNSAVAWCHGSYRQEEQIACTRLVLGRLVCLKIDNADRELDLNRFRGKNEATSEQASQFTDKHAIIILCR
jgi:hypothetical protein